MQCWPRAPTPRVIPSAQQRTLSHKPSGHFNLNICNPILHSPESLAAKREQHRPEVKEVTTATTYQLLNLVIHMWVNTAHKHKKQCEGWIVALSTCNRGFSEPGQRRHNIFCAWGRTSKQCQSLMLFFFLTITKNDNLLPFHSQSPKGCAGVHERPTTAPPSARLFISKSHPQRLPCDSLHEYRKFL